MKTKQWMWVGLLSLVLSGCSTEAAATVNNLTQSAQDHIQNVESQDNRYVRGIKVAEFNAYPGHVIGEDFDAFFGDPTWKYFETEEGQGVVEFTGWMTYEEKDVKARLQFLINDDDSFDVGALEINDLPQAEYMTTVVIESAFGVRGGQ